MNHIKTQKIQIEKTVASISLKETDDVTIFNREQPQIFDRIRNHYFVVNEIQLFSQMNDQTNIEKFKIIDLIFVHLIFYAIQDSSNQTTLNKNRDFVIRLISIDVIAYNIIEYILRSLLKLFV